MQLQGQLSLQCKQKLRENSRDRDWNSGIEHWERTEQHWEQRSRNPRKDHALDLSFLSFAACLCLRSVLPPLATMVCFCVCVLLLTATSSCVFLHCVCSTVLHPFLQFSQVQRSALCLVSSQASPLTFKFSAVFLSCLPLAPCFWRQSDLVLRWVLFSEILQMPGVMQGPVSLQSENLAISVQKCAVSCNAQCRRRLTQRLFYR